MILCMQLGFATDSELSAAAAAYLLNYVSPALNLGTNNLQFIDFTTVVATRPTWLAGWRALPVARKPPRPLSARARALLAAARSHSGGSTAPC